MKTKCAGNKERALTLVEVLLVLAGLIILAGLILPKLAKAKVSKHGNCIWNLKQIGLAMRMFSNDHEERFPWNVPMEKGGAQEQVKNGDPVSQFLVMTNELSSPKILACSWDTNVLRTTDFDKLNRTNISYFVCLEGDENMRNNLLAGDRNITGGKFKDGILVLDPRAGQAGWGTNIHRSAGNVALADGSARQVLAKELNQQLQTMTNEAVRLLVP